MRRTGRYATPAGEEEGKESKGNRGGGREGGKGQHMRRKGRRARVA